MAKSAPAHDPLIDAPAQTTTDGQSADAPVQTVTAPSAPVRPAAPAPAPAPEAPLSAEAQAVARAENALRDVRAAEAALESARREYAEASLALATFRETADLATCNAHAAKVQAGLDAERAAEDAKLGPRVTIIRRNPVPPLFPVGGRA